MRLFLCHFELLTLTAYFDIDWLEIRMIVPQFRSTFSLLIKPYFIVFKEVLCYSSIFNRSRVPFYYLDNNIDYLG